jgi:hypothetical protein
MRSLCGKYGFLPISNVPEDRLKSVVHPVPEDPYEFDVALSFAGEDRQVAESLADGLRNFGVRVFYDRYEQASR